MHNVYGNERNASCWPPVPGVHMLRYEMKEKYFGQSRI